MMNGTEWAMGPGGWLWMALIAAIYIAVLVAIVWMIASARWGRSAAPAEDAGHILKARFARGDISSDEYEQARRLLGVG